MSDNKYVKTETKEVLVLSDIKTGNFAQHKISFEKAGTSMLRANAQRKNSNSSWTSPYCTDLEFPTEELIKLLERGVSRANLQVINEKGEVLGPLSDYVSGSIGSGELDYISVDNMGCTETYYVFLDSEPKASKKGKDRVAIKISESYEPDDSSCYDYKFVFYQDAIDELIQELKAL